MRASILKLSSKIAATLLATVVGFCLGGYAAAFYCDRWVMPGLIKQYPHDGQLGLEVMMYAANGAFAAGLFVLLAGIVWIVKTSKTKASTFSVEVDHF